MGLEALLHRLVADPATVTAVEKYGLAADIRTTGEALSHLKACVEHSIVLRPCLTFREALMIERVKIGYLAGYFDYDVRERIERLYRCVHPFAGAAEPKQRARRLQLGDSFYRLCGVWDSQPLNSRAFGMHRQPTWDAGFCPRVQALAGARA